jgi:hypothetical protein
MIYLASPYTADTQWEKDDRAYLVCKAAAILKSQGMEVFSPIAHSHYIEKTGFFHGDNTYWLPFDFKFMHICECLYVLMLPGWEKSEGIKEEIDYAIELGLPIVYVKLIGDKVIKANL